MDLIAFYKQIEEDNSKYQNFWNWFLQMEKTFSDIIRTENDIQKNFISVLSEKLEGFGDKYFFLIGINEQNDIELIFSAEGIVKNVVFVEELVAAAPLIDGWKFIALKPCIDIGDINIRMYDDEAEIIIDQSKLFFYPNLHPELPDEIDINIIHTDMDENNRNIIGNGIFIYLDNLLGELEFMNNIDHLQLISKDEVKDELIPISKLKDYLKWRYKEFIEKYDDAIFDEEEAFVLYETREDGNVTGYFTINDTAMQWNRKVSHPWIAIISLRHPDSNESVLAEATLIDEVNIFYEEISSLLKKENGYITIGKRTYLSNFDFYFACKEFRYPSKILEAFKMKYGNEWIIDSKIVKDKYWQTFSNFF